MSPDAVAPGIFFVASIFEIPIRKPEGNADF